MFVVKPDYSNIHLSFENKQSATLDGSLLNRFCTELFDRYLSSTWNAAGFIPKPDDQVDPSLDYQ